jgi:uncharacterized protein (DUF362 family)
MQRSYFSISDGIISGDCDGPLRPRPFPLGCIVSGWSPYAVDFVSANLMRFNIEKLPLIKNSFTNMHYSLTNFVPSDIKIYLDSQKITEDKLYREFGKPATPAKWWEEISSCRDFNAR